MRETLGVPLGAGRLRVRDAGRWERRTISLVGTPEEQQSRLPRLRSARREDRRLRAQRSREAGSDVAADGDHAPQPPADGWRVNGAKTYISNGGIADF